MTAFKFMVSYQLSWRCLIDWNQSINELHNENDKLASEIDNLQTQIMR